MTSVSVIIVSYRESDETDDCVKRIMAGSTRPDEIILVHNGLRIAKLVELAHKYPVIRNIFNEKNLGFGPGVNTGADASRCDYLLVSNPDVEFDHGAIEAMTAYMKAHPDVCVLGPRVNNPDGSLQPSARRFPRPSALFFNRKSWLTRLWKGNVISRGYLFPYDPDNGPADVDWLSGCCMMIRKDVFQQIGGFDPGYFVFMEDVDLCLRVWQETGKRVVYFPETSVVHATGISDHLNPDIIRHRHASIIRYIDKHFRSSPWFLRFLGKTAIRMRKMIRLLAWFFSRKK